ncbi:hypothetical protein HMPREF9120_00035 [Neisseria sp. oral taxon 020 str. F0370]|nr:hypothetical protein HMPREF9120_00035 [Neisseria sp. oral taxon 020 str. F0370]
MRCGCIVTVFAASGRLKRPSETVLSAFRRPFPMPGNLGYNRARFLTISQ